MSRSFRIKYSLQSLQTKSNPLFTHIKAYIISDGTKRLISQANQRANNHVYFRSSIEQKDKTLTIDSTTGNYQQAKIRLVFQFEAQQRYIKMGETFVDVADIMNNNKNGQLQGYKLEKCYDRNAKVWISVDYSLNQYRRLNKSAELKHKEEHFDTNSHYNLPQPKGRVKSIYQTNRDFTGSSALQNSAFKEDLSLISQKKTSYNHTRPHYQRQTAGKTEVNKKTFQRLQEVQKLQEDLSAVSTNLRLVQQQLTAVQHKYLEKTKLLQQTEQKLKNCLNENSKINEKFQKLQKRLGIFQKNQDSQKQAQISEAQKYLKMYHQSQMQRNKLLFQIDTERQQIRQKIKEVQRRSEQNLKKANSAQKHQSLLKEDLKCCMLQMANCQRQYKQQKRQRLKAEQDLKQAVLQMVKLTEKLQINKSEIDNLNKSANQTSQQIEIGKLTIQQLSKQNKQLKKQASKKQSIVEQYEQQIKKSNQVLQSQRLKYSQQLQQMEQNAERQHKNFEKYIEELETKTIHDYNSNNQNSQLKRQMAKLKRCLKEEKQRATILQSEIQKYDQENQLLELKVTQTHNQTLQIEKQKSLLEYQLRQFRKLHEQVQCFENDGEQKAASQRQAELIDKCYMERDEFWKKEFEKLEQDTKIMIEKHKKQKESLCIKNKASQFQLAEKSKQIYDNKVAIIQLEESVSKQDRQTKLLQTKLNNFEAAIKENQELKSNQQKKVEQLVKKKAVIQELEVSLSQINKKLAIKTKQLFSVKAELEKQKDAKSKYKAQVKEILTNISNLLAKSQKHQIFFDELRFSLIQPQNLLLLNSTIKLYVEKHNRIRLKIEKSQELEKQLSQKQMNINKNFSALRFQRKMSNSQKKSSISQLREDDELSSSSRLKQSEVLNFVPQKQENQVIISILRQQCFQVKKRLQTQKNRRMALQKQFQRQNQIIEQQRRLNSKIKELLDSKSQQIDVSVQNYNKAQKRIDSAKYQIKNLTQQLQNTKIQLQNLQKNHKLEKTQISRRNSASKAFLPKTHDDSYYKIIELQKRLKQSQQQLEKFKRQKEEKRKDEAPYNKQSKSLEAKLKQNDITISNLRKQLQQQIKSNEQQKQIYSIRLKKAKQTFQEEVAYHLKQKNQLKENLEAHQIKTKQLNRQTKTLQQNLKKLNIQLSNIAEKDERNKKMLSNQWQLKMKSLQTQHENELSVMKRQMQDQRALQRSLKEVTQKKQKQIKELKDQLDKKVKQIQNLISQCQIYGVRIKSLEEQEGLYKQTIGVLEKKIFLSSESSKRNIQGQAQNSDVRSNFSLKTYTFR